MLNYVCNKYPTTDFSSKIPLGMLKNEYFMYTISKSRNSKVDKSQPGIKAILLPGKIV